jgi:hypothetical protein
VTFATGPCDSCVGEITQAKYVVRTFLEHHRRRVVRTYGTHLFDRSAEPRSYGKGMGLARHDGARKPSFEALARMIRLFGDPGPEATPSVVRIEASAPPPHLERAVFRRRDGTLLLALWLAVASGSEELTGTVRLRLPPGVRARAIHRLVAPETEPASVEAGRLLEAPVSDDVTVLELSSPDT